MNNYLIDGHNLSALFTGPSVKFSEEPRNHVPDKGSIIYTVWDNNDKFIYVGIAGTQKSLDKRSPISRMRSHKSGRRSGDQFCVYVHDMFVIPEVVKGGTYEPSHRGLLDKLTQEYIQENLSYRFCGFQTDDSNKVVQQLETEIKNGRCGLKPLLNGTDTYGGVKNDSDVEKRSRFKIIHRNSKQPRQPNFTFQSMLKIPIGSKLTFRDDNTKVAIVKGERKAEFEGIKSSLSGITKRICQSKFRADEKYGRILDHWIFENETLLNRRFRMEPSPD